MPFVFAVVVRASAAFCTFGAAEEPCPADPVRLVPEAIDESAGGVPCYQIVTPAATYFLEQSGGGLSSLLDRDGRDWLGFHPRPGSRAGGEYRGFPNAVHQQAGNYFHPKNAATEPCSLTVEAATPVRVAIAAVTVHTPESSKGAG
jgi:hypothetical protein